MQAIVQVTEKHISTYRAIRNYIYHHGKSPDLVTISDICGIRSDKEILTVLRDLKTLGYVFFDGPQVRNIHIAH